MGFNTFEQNRDEVKTKKLNMEKSLFGTPDLSDNEYDLKIPDLAINLPDSEYVHKNNIDTFIIENQLSDSYNKNEKTKSGKSDVDLKKKSSKKSDIVSKKKS